MVSAPELKSVSSLETLVQRSVGGSHGLGRLSAMRPCGGMDSSRGIT